MDIIWDPGFARYLVFRLPPPSRISHASRGSLVTGVVFWARRPSRARQRERQETVRSQALLPHARNADMADKPPAASKRGGEEEDNKTTNATTVALPAGAGDELATVAPTRHAHWPFFKHRVLRPRGIRIGFCILSVVYGIALS